MSGEPTVLGMINDNLKDIKDEQKKITGCMGQIKVDVATNKVKIDVHIKEQQEMKTDFQHHVRNKKKHYNQGYEETITDRLSRRKAEITIGSVIATVITFLINWWVGG